MPSRKTGEIIKGLLKKGFIRKDSDHVYLHYYTLKKEKTRIFTKVSHGSKEYGNKMLCLMARQLKLSLPEFIDLIDCPMGQKEYEKKLKEKGR